MSEQVDPERISRAVRAYFLAIRAMDPEAIANTFAEDGTTYDPVGSEGSLDGMRFANSSVPSTRTSRVWR